MEFKNKENRKNNPFANIKLKSIAEVEQQGLIIQAASKDLQIPQSSERFEQTSSDPINSSQVRNQINDMIQNPFTQMGL